MIMTLVIVPSRSAFVLLPLWLPAKSASAVALGAEATDPIG